MQPPRNLLLSVFNFPDHTFTEDEILSLWRYICPSSQHLETVDGKSVFIEEKGRVNRASGPDIKNVELRLDGISRSGSVEIHRQTSDWYHHGHHRNTEFNTVILHVVFTGEESTVRRRDDNWVPTLKLKHHLPQIKQLSEQKYGHSVKKRQESVKRPCFSHNPNPSRIRSHLERISKTWLARKASSFRNTSKNHFLIRLIGALGYSRNHEQFLELGRRISIPEFRNNLRKLDHSRSLEGYLLGLGGWFQDRNQSVNRSVYRRLKAWNEQEDSNSRVGSGHWTNSRIRPQAKPVRRWIIFGWGFKYVLEQYGSFTEWVRTEIVDLVKSNSTQNMLRTELDEVFNLPQRNYWKNHYSLRDDVHEKVPSPVGKTWYDQVSINLIFPYLYYLALRDGDSELRESLFSLLEKFPKTMSNRRTDRLEKQWGFTDDDFQWKNGFLQQGGVYLYKEGCKKGRCSKCPLNGDNRDEQLAIFNNNR